MTLKIIYEDKESTGAKVKVDRPLWLDAGGRLVEDGDSAAVTLYCSAGKSVLKADFEERGGKLSKKTAKKVTKKTTKKED